MIRRENLLRLSLTSGSEDPEAVQAAITLEGEPLGASWRLDPARLRLISQLSDGFRQILRDGCSAESANEAVAGLGLELFDLCLAPVWKALHEKRLPGLDFMLFIESDALERALIPWELMRPPGAEPLALDPRWSLRRAPLPGAAAPRCCPTLPPPPLRVLIHPGAAPQAERKNASDGSLALLEMVDAIEADFAFDLVEEPGAEGLRAALERFQPQALILAGGALVNRRRAYYAFGPAGEPNEPSEVWTAAEMGERILRGSGVQLVLVVEQRPRGKAPASAAAHTLAAALAADGAPLALGWPAPDLAPLGAFLERLAAGAGVDEALRVGRAAWASSADSSDPGWPLPTLCSPANQYMVFNVASVAPRIIPERRAPPIIPPPGLAGGCAEPFWGRAGLLHPLAESLRDGALTRLLLIGPEGVGKTTLALAILKETGLQGTDSVISLFGTQTNPITAPRLIQAALPWLRKRGGRRMVEGLKEPGQPLSKRLEMLQALLNGNASEGKWPVLFLDGLAFGIDAETGGWRDGELGAVLEGLWADESAAVRLVATSRVKPATLAARGAALRVITLGPLAEAGLTAHLMHDPHFSRARPPGPEGWRLLTTTCAFLAQRPGLIGPFLGLLRREGVAARDETHLAEELLASAPPGSRRALARCALIDFPAPAALLARLAPGDAPPGASGSPSGFPIEEWPPTYWPPTYWIETGLVHHDDGAGPQRLWWVNPAVKSWLAGAGVLDPDEPTHVRRQAADALMAAFEENREGEFGQVWFDLLLAARSLRLAVGDGSGAAAVMDQINQGLKAQGFWGEMARLNGEMADRFQQPWPACWAGLAAYQGGDRASAQRWWSLARDWAAESDPEAAASALAGLADCHQIEKEWPEAEARLREGLDLLKGAGLEAPQANLWERLATLAHQKKSWRQAADALEEALAIHRAAGEAAGQALVLLRMAEVARIRLRHEQAVDNFQHALTLQLQAGDAHGEGSTRALLGELLCEQGDLAAALPHLEEAIQRFQDQERHSDLAAILPLAGRLWLSLERLPEARARFQAALPLLEAFGQDALIGSVLHQLGVIHTLEGDPRPAAIFLRGAWEIRERMGDRAGKAASFFQMGRLVLAHGHEMPAWELMGLGYLIDVQINSADAPRELALLKEMAEEMGTPWSAAIERLDEIWNAYVADGGEGLMLGSLAHWLEPGDREVPGQGQG